jgi:hypothetical protein
LYEAGLPPGPGRATFSPTGTRTSARQFDRLDHLPPHPLRRTTPALFDDQLKDEAAAAEYSTPCLAHGPDDLIRMSAVTRLFPAGTAAAAVTDLDRRQDPP